MWEIETKSQFRRQLKNLSPELQNQVRFALTKLQNIENPKTLGEYKHGLRVFAYDLDKSNRILFNVRYDDRVIELIRVGDHKNVYGKG